MRRKWVVAALVIGGVMALTSSADAKVPPFELEVTATPNGGTDIVVRVVDEPSFAPSDLDQILAAFPLSSLTNDLRPRPEVRGDVVAIALDRVRVGVWHAAVRLPDDVEWVIVPFPFADVSSAELADNGYPRPVRLGGHDGSGSSSLVLPALGAFGAVVAVALAGFAMRGQLGRCKPAVNLSS